MYFQNKYVQDKHWYTCVKKRSGLSAINYIYKRALSKWPTDLALETLELSLVL